MPDCLHTSVLTSRSLGACSTTHTFTLHQKIVVLQNIIYSLFSPVFVFLSHIIDGYDVQGYPVCLDGHLLPIKPKIKCSWHTSAIYGWKNNHKLEGWNTSMNELRICWKNVNLARGAAEAVTRWTDAVTQLAGFVICQTCALPIWTPFRVEFALSLQKHDELAVVDACCLTHLKYNKHFKKSLNPY